MNALRRCVFLSALALLLPGCNPRGPQPSNSPPIAVLALNDWVLEGEKRPSSPAADAPRRIVSAAPRITEILCALGMRGALVGRTRYCTYPPDIAEVADIGDLAGLNVERLIELKPDLILVSGTSRAQSDRLAPLGIRIESLPDRTLDELFASITKVDEILHTGNGDRLIANIKADLEAVDRAYRLSRRKVLLLIGTLADPPSPPFVAGPGSFYDELLHRAGLENAATEAGKAFGSLSLEYILKADPDVIIELDPDGRSRPAGDADALRTWTQVGPLRAVIQRRVRVLRGPQHYLVGPRIAETYAAICEAVARGN